MAEVALYRKYRSQRFSEVIGQAHVVQTLQAAVASGRLSHAYLFTGPRGVGKTSVARLLARSLNCTGKGTKPCGTCSNCQVEIGSHLDLIEIDAASNRRIDEVRELRDKINSAPSMGRYKIYIIDEVHMLTTEAFNALLKTLEEPPAHAVFILATTEAHKLPATIISRTQRFNFKTIEQADLVTQLLAIASAEQIKIEPAAVELLAQASGGSFRDAISLLDQVAGSGQDITVETTRHILGWSQEEEILAISRALATKHPGELLEVIDRLTASGIQAGQICRQLSDYWRGLMHAAAGNLAPSEAMQPILNSMSLADIAQVVQKLASLHQNGLSALSLEVALIQLAAPRAKAAAATPGPVAAPEPTSAPAPTPAAAPAPAAAERQVKPSRSAGDASALWPKALLLIKSRNNSLYALLQSCGVEVGESEVVITSRFNFHRQRLQEEKNFNIIESALAKTYGRKIKVTTALESAKPVPAAAGSELVGQALEILGGEIVE